MSKSQLLRSKAGSIARPSLLILIFMVSVGPFGDTEYTPSLPQIAQSFGVEYSTTILTMTSYLIGLAISQIFYGPISDKFGRRPVLLYGVAIFTLGSFACLFSPNIESLILSRFIQAVGACSGAIISNTAVRDAFPENMRGAVYARINAAFAIAPGAGPVVGVYIDRYFHWRMNFAVLLVLAILLFISAYFFFPETNKHLNETAAQPKHIVLNYLKLFSDPYYVPYIVILGLSIGMVYNCLTQAPDLVINQLGLGSFSIIIIAASVMMGFVVGSLICNFLFHFFSENKIIMMGLFIILLSGVILYWSVGLPNQSLYNSLIPIVGEFIGIALILPMATARAMLPFQTITGSAAAFLGFTQMGLASLATGLLSVNHYESLYVMPISFLVIGTIATLVYVFGIALRPNRHREII